MNDSKENLTIGKKVLYSLLLVIIFFGTVEIGLRLWGIHVETSPLSVMQTYDWGITENWGGTDIEIVKYTTDPLLLWRPIPNNFNVNSFGFRGAEISVEKPASVKRIACMGDSCTFQGPEAYPELVEQALNWSSTQKKYEVIDAGTIAYSSHQGKLLYKTHVSRLKPDVVTVCYGWNDHWLAYGPPDSERGTKSHLLIKINNWLRPLEFYQLMIEGISKAYAYIHEPDMEHRPLRVSDYEYRENLTQIFEMAADDGAKVIFMTAPPGYRYGDSDSMKNMYHCVEAGTAESIEQVALLHSKYNEIVREVARETDSYLIDLANKVASLPENDYFQDDLIHLNLKGRYWVCKEISDALQKLKFLDETTQQRVDNFMGEHDYLPVNTDESIDYYEKKVKNYVDNSEINFLLGILYRDKGNAIKARSYLEKLKDRDVQLAFYYVILGKTYYDLKDDLNALNCFRTATELEPNNCNNWIQSGLALFYLKRYDEALDDFHKADKLCPGYWLVYCDLAYTYKEMGKLKSALKYFEEWHKLDEKSVDCLGNIASIHTKLKNFRDADIALRKAEALPKPGPWIAKLRNQWKEAREKEKN